MNMFNISLDNDITYLLDEIGYNVKINNIDSKAIINNVGNETDDKRIITKSELKRGDYINYNDLYFLVLDEINDKRYNTYNKAIIRRCNFDIKFVIGDRLYLYYAIVEGDKFYIQNDSIISMSADTITVTLPKTPITQQIKEQDSFIKWGKKWEIQGINYTKDGLVILNCKATTINTNTDDIENEIANKDKLTDTTIIYPFDDVPDIPVEPEEPTEPTEPEEPVEQDITYTITAQMPYADVPDNEIWLDDPPAIYTIHKFVDGAEIDGKFTFEVTDTSIVTITDTTDNTISIIANDFVGKKNIKLIATDVDTKQVVIEKDINVVGR